MIGERSRDLRGQRRVTVSYFLKRALSLILILNTICSLSDLHQLHYATLQVCQFYKQIFSFHPNFDKFLLFILCQKPRTCIVCYICTKHAGAGTQWLWKGWVGGWGWVSNQLLGTSGAIPWFSWSMPPSPNLQLLNAMALDTTSGGGGGLCKPKSVMVFSVIKI